MATHEQEFEDFIEALQCITTASGAFKRDPFEHLKSCALSMQTTAVNVLRKHGITPRRDDDLIDGEKIRDLPHDHT